MATRHHHGGILIGGLLLTDGADEDGMELVARRQGDLDGQLLRRRPLGPLILHDRLQLEQGGQGDGARGGGDVERRAGRQAEQGAEFAGEGGRQVVPGAGGEEEAAVRAGGEVGLVGERAGEPAQLGEVAGLEVGEVPARVEEGGVPAVRVEQVDELQLREFEFQVRAPAFELLAVDPGPVDGREEVAVVPEVGEDGVHLLEGVTEGGGMDGVDEREGYFGGGGMGGRGAGRGCLMGGGGDVGEELGCYVELAFAEEVHCDCSIDQRSLGGKGVVVGAGEGFVLESLETTC